MNKATGTFEVVLDPLGPDPYFEEPGLARMSVDKTFSGGLEATSKG